MKRQAINTSIKELRAIADALEKEGREMVKDINDQNAYSEMQTWSLPIINPEGLSDTWKFESEKIKMRERS